MKSVPFCAIFAFTLGLVSEVVRVLSIGGADTQVCPYALFQGQGRPCRFSLLRSLYT